MCRSGSDSDGGSGDVRVHMGEYARVCAHACLFVRVRARVCGDRERATLFLPSLLCFPLAVACDLKRLQ